MSPLSSKVQEAAKKFPKGFYWVEGANTWSFLKTFCDRFAEGEYIQKVYSSCKEERG